MGYRYGFYQPGRNNGPVGTPRIISISLAGFCRVCNKPQPSGTRTEWTKGNGLRCLDCVAQAMNSHQGTPPSPQVAPQAASQPPVPPGPSGLLFAALAALEALIIDVHTENLTKEAEKAWETYQNIKARCQGTGFVGEERNAMKLALIHAVKLAL